MEWKLEHDQWICFMVSIGHSICEILWNSEGLPEHLGKNMVLEEMKMYQCLCVRRRWDGTRWSSAKGLKRYCSFYSYSVIEFTGYLHGYFIQHTSNQQPFRRSHTICFVTWIDVLQLLRSRISDQLTHLGYLVHLRGVRRRHASGLGPFDCYGAPRETAPIEPYKSNINWRDIFSLRCDFPG